MFRNLISIGAIIFLASVSPVLAAASESQAEQQSEERAWSKPGFYIFVGGANGRLVSLTYVDNKMHYVYLDIGNNKFCTLQMPRSLVENSNRIGNQHLATNLCCY